MEVLWSWSRRGCRRCRRGEEEGEKSPPRTISASERTGSLTHAPHQFLDHCHRHTTSSSPSPTVSVSMARWPKSSSQISHDIHIQAKITKEMRQEHRQSGANRRASSAFIPETTAPHLPLSVLTSSSRSIAAFVSTIELSIGIPLRSSHYHNHPTTPNHSPPPQHTTHNGTLRPLYLQAVVLLTIHTPMGLNAAL